MLGAHEERHTVHGNGQTNREEKLLVDKQTHNFLRFLYCMSRLSFCLEENSRMLLLGLSFVNFCGEWSKNDP